MNTIGNLLWIFLGGGILIALLYFVGGVLMIFTIIGAPFGLQCIKLSILGLLPFGKEIVDLTQSDSFLNVALNILWIVLGGIWLTILHGVLALIMTITIIGIPFARQHIKLAAVALTPFGKDFRYTS